MCSQRRLGVELTRLLHGSWRLTAIRWERGEHQQRLGAICMGARAESCDHAASTMWALFGEAAAHPGPQPLGIQGMLGLIRATPENDLEARVTA